MNLSCLPVSFFNDITGGNLSVGAWARMGVEIGLDGIDLSILFVPDHSPAGLIALRRAIEDCGIGVVMVTTYPDFTHPEPAQRKLELVLEQEAISVAAALGAGYVRVTAGQAHPGTGRDEGINWAVEGLTQLVETTRDSGVTLVYENHGKPGAWKYTDFSEPPEIFLEIARRTAGVGLGINFDTGNATAFSKDPVGLLDQVIDRVVTIHASDTESYGELRHVRLGTGATPYLELFGKLKQSGWDGWICMEEASFEGREGVEKAANFVRQAWKNA